MKNTQRGIAVFFLVGTAVVLADDTSPKHSLDIVPATPRVDISPRSPGRNYVRLPTLEYSFQVTANCAAMFHPQSVSLSIADSRSLISQEQLSGDATELQLVLRVPAKQLAPLVVEDFCVTPPKLDKPNGITTVRSALSAQAALLCVHDDRQEIVYRSIPLDIILACAPGEDEPE